MKGIESILQPEQRTALEQYAAFITEVNQRVNVVSRKDIDKLWEHHVLPSLAFAALGRIQDGEYILDIGSGGGFPGIVNAILFPGSEFVLVDSTRKKVDVLNMAIEKLGLENATALWSRVEVLPEEHPEFVDAFDRTTSRAVAPLKKIVAWSAPLVREGGTVEALKGGEVSAEIASIDTEVEQFRLSKEMCTDTEGRLAQLVILSTTTTK